MNISKNKSSKSFDILATINKISPFIPAKLPKEINKISKYFKKNQQSGRKKETNKSYAQTSTPANSTREALKIKETFPNLPTKKIKNIQKVINGRGKTKPKLHMTTKRPFQKQVIVLMSNNNKLKFMMDLSSHIVNIDRALKNIKSDTKADFVQLKQTGIVITTNKIAAQLDLQTIEQYVKSANHIEAEQVETLVYLSLNYISKSLVFCICSRILILL